MEISISFEAIERQIKRFGHVKVCMFHIGRICAIELRFESNDSNIKFYQILNQIGTAVWAMRPLVNSVDFLRYARKFVLRMIDHLFQDDRTFDVQVGVLDHTTLYCLNEIKTKIAHSWRIIRLST